MGRAARRTVSKNRRVFDALPDTVDFRDRMFTPTLIEVPPVSDLDAYRDLKLLVLDQGADGACTGFGLATVANYLLRRLYPERKIDPVSPRMLYVMARRYDEWPDENYVGSSARGAIKGWQSTACAPIRFGPLEVGTTIFPKSALSMRSSGRWAHTSG